MARITAGRSIVFRCLSSSSRRRKPSAVIGILIIAAQPQALRHNRTGNFSNPREKAQQTRSEEHTSELQSLMRISYAVFCLKKKKIEIEKSKNKQEKPNMS